VPESFHVEVLTPEGEAEEESEEGPEDLAVAERAAEPEPAGVTS